MNALKSWWGGLQARERQLLGGGGLLLTVMLLWAFVWYPFTKELHRLRSSVTEQRELLAWMEQAAQEAKRLQGSQTHSAPRGGRQSLLTIVDSTARSQGLGTSLKRVQPEGEAVRVWLEQASFDTVLRWLNLVSQQHGVSITGLALERSATPGQVDVRAILAGPQP